MDSYRDEITCGGIGVLVSLDAKHIVLATLVALTKEKKIGMDVVQRAIQELGINSEKANPANT